MPGRDKIPSMLDEASLAQARHEGTDLGPAAPESRWVDETTWADLDMDAVCAHIDRTRSIPGSMALCRMLRFPVFSRETLDEREALIGALAPDGAASASLDPALQRLGAVAGGGDLAALLWQSPPAAFPSEWLVRPLVLLAIASIPLALFVGGPAVFAPLIAFALNAAFHFRTRMRLQIEIRALRFVGGLRRCAREALASREPLIEGHRRRLRASLHSTRPAARRLALLSAGDLKDMLYEYFNIFLLLELQAYQWTVAQWNATGPSLGELFATLGELDALSAVARWRGELDVWCRPTIEPGPPMVDLVDGVHPLIDDPVPNSIALTTRGCIVTGANMSGKSTLLRTLGINAILAQSLVTCTARGYRATPLRVATSMRVGDDVATGKSRYLAEAERLLTIVRLTASDTPTLCLVDELLSGTNAVERLAASRAILDFLASHGLLVVAATHDLELTEYLAERFDSVHFADDFRRNDLAFDHRLRRGVATTRNAIHLLERLGYPEEIVSRARGLQ